MRVAVMQPYFFPYVGYFQLLHAVDRFVFLDDVQYIRRGWINRNRILVDGRETLITIPVQHGERSDRICDIALDSSDWRRKRIELLRHAYARAPHFRAVLPIVAGVIEAPAATIADLARASVLRIVDLLSIPASIVASSRAYGNQDLRGEERIVDIARRESATIYVNLPGGRELYHRDVFARAGMELRFVQPRVPDYDQGGAAFVPRLSIIDLLMWTGIAGTRSLLEAYTVEP
jgi:hypothetical protein